nr:hypothetical protein Itr_chr06CG09660 [Ipomoea trifida]
MGVEPDFHRWFLSTPLSCPNRSGTGGWLWGPKRLWTETTRRCFLGGPYPIVFSSDRSLLSTRHEWSCREESNGDSPLGMQSHYMALRRHSTASSTTRWSSTGQVQGTLAIGRLDLLFFLGVLWIVFLGGGGGGTNRPDNARDLGMFLGNYHDLGF